MSGSDVCDRICHFFYKIIPEAELGKSFSKEKLRLVVKESVSLSKLAELPEVQELTHIQEHEVSQACKYLLLSLLDNLRFGTKDTTELKRLLHSQLGYHDLEYESCIDQRNLIRSEFLKYSEELKKTPNFEQLKSYLKLVHFTRLHEISVKKFECELSYFAGDGQKKLISMLSLSQSKDVEHFHVAAQLLQQLHPDWTLLTTTPPKKLIAALELWPDLRSRTFQVICDICIKIQSNEEIDEVADFIATLMKAGEESSIGEQTPENHSNITKSLMTALDAANLSHYTKSRLLHKIFSNL